MILNKNTTVILNGRSVKPKLLTVFAYFDSNQKNSEIEFALRTEDDTFYHGVVKKIEVINENIHSKRKDTISRVTYSLASYPLEED